MSTSYVRFTFETSAGVKFDPTSVVLSDPTGAYGVKRNDTDAVVVADATAMTNTAVGVYETSWTDPAYDLTYTAYAEYVIDGETYRVPKTVTGTATDAVTSSSVRWTVDRLAEHLRNHFNVDRNAAGGTVPDMLTWEVRQAGQHIWTHTDWRFRVKRGTLTTVAETEAAALPSDFYELWQRWLRDPQGTAANPIVFTEDPSRYQAYADEFDMTDSTHDGEPRMACIVQDTSEDEFTWHVLLAPRPGAVYTYPFWYLQADPWTSGATDDDEVPKWPQPFDAGWEMRARYKLQSILRGDDSWRELRGGFQRWLSDMRAENNETLCDSMERTEDYYKDHVYPSAATGLFRGRFLT